MNNSLKRMLVMSLVKWAEHLERIGKEWLINKPDAQWNESRMTKTGPGRLIKDTFGGVGKGGRSTLAKDPMLKPIHSHHYQFSEFKVKKTTDNVNIQDYIVHTTCVMLENKYVILLLPLI